MKEAVALGEPTQEQAPGMNCTHGVPHWNSNWRIISCGINLCWIRLWRTVSNQRDSTLEQGKNWWKSKQQRAIWQRPHELSCLAELLSDWNLNSIPLCCLVEGGREVINEVEPRKKRDRKKFFSLNFFSHYLNWQSCLFFVCLVGFVCFLFVCLFFSLKWVWFAHDGKWFLFRLMHELPLSYFLPSVHVRRAAWWTRGKHSLLSHYKFLYVSILIFP